MDIYKAYKFRIYPDENQKSKTHQNIGLSRLVYNYFLNLKIKKYKNVCEYRKVKDLSIRKWRCEECGYIHDRDINSSQNILFEGLRLYYKSYL